MKLAILELTRFDGATLQPWSSDADCLMLSVNPARDCNSSNPPVAITNYEAVAQRQFAVYEPLFEAGSNDEGPRLPGAEIGFMAAAEFSLFMESRYHLVLLSDLDRLYRQHRIDRIEYITEQADGGKYHEAAQAFADCHRVPYRRILLQQTRLGALRRVSRTLDAAADRLSPHGRTYLDYARAMARRRIYQWRLAAASSQGRQAVAPNRKGVVRAAMLVYHAKSWRYLLPIRQSLLDQGHDVLLISPRLECDKLLDQAGVDHVSIRRRLPNVRLRRSVAAYLAHAPWHIPDIQLNVQLAEGSPLRRLIVRRGLAACDIYADVAATLPELLRRNRINVVLGTDSGSVAARCFFRTAERMNMECVFVQHGSVFTLVGAREYMLQSHRLLWSRTACDILARSGVARADRNNCLGSPFHEERFGSNIVRPSATDAMEEPLVLVTFGVPGGYVTAGSFQRAAREVFDAASKLPGARFVVKPHPGDPGRVWRQLEADFRLPNVEISTDRDTYDLMRQCRALVTMFSTTGSEAICMDKPVVSVNLDGREGGIEFLEAGAAYTARREGELAGILHSLFDTPPGGDRLAEARRAFSESFVHREERPAAERAAEFLECLVAKHVAEPATDR